MLTPGVREYLDSISFDPSDVQRLDDNFTIMMLEELSTDLVTAAPRGEIKVLANRSRFDLFCKKNRGNTPLLNRIKFVELTLVHILLEEVDNTPFGGEGTGEGTGIPITQIEDPPMPPQGQEQDLDGGEEGEGDTGQQSDTTTPTTSTTVTVPPPSVLVTSHVIGDVTIPAMVYRYHPRMKVSWVAIGIDAPNQDEQGEGLLERLLSYARA
jgi:hypothetical protein